MKKHVTANPTTLILTYSFFKRAFVVYRAFKGDQPWVAITDYHATANKAFNAARSGLR